MQIVGYVLAYRSYSFVCTLHHLIIIIVQTWNYKMLVFCCIVFCHLLYIYSSKTGNLFSLVIVQFMMSANSRIRFGLQIVFVCLYITPSHYHHCANFIWRHWNYKMPVRYDLSSVWVRLSIFSQLSIIQYVGLCVFSLPISFVMNILWEYIYFCLVIIIKSEVWTISHCFGLGHETMVCAVCLSIFLFFLYICTYSRSHQTLLLKWLHHQDGKSQKRLRARKSGSS